MFNNIGGKIKGLAKVLCWVGIIVSVLVGILLIASPSGGSGYSGFTDSATIVLGILTIIVGSISSWVGSFVLYGFGELVENSSAIKNELQHKEEK